MYPIMLNLTDRPVLIVGGGVIAFRKITDLLSSNAVVTVISPKLNSKIPADCIHWHARTYQPGDVSGFDLIFACTDNDLVNQKVVADCQPSQLVNNTSQKEQSSFFNMATVLSDETLYGVSTLGKNPKKAKEAKEELSKWLEAKRKRDDLV